MDPFGAGLQEVRSNPQSLVQCWSLLRSRFWLFWFWCQFEKGLFIARSIIAQEIVHCSFLVQIQCPHSNNGAKVLQLAATSCYYYMPRGGFPTFGQVILENLLKESWEKRGEPFFVWKSTCDYWQITLLRVIPTMTCWVEVVRWGLSLRIWWEEWRIWEHWFQVSLA